MLKQLIEVAASTGTTGSSLTHIQENKLIPENKMYLREKLDGVGPVGNRPSND